uniref:SJCHGC02974 protein n=1 Tax=Schistosoma japonicum TaxID=6182 RepID=Q5BT21_SCHJA|nr:SJCHGC02974 protein [Schistosoma japonicum]
MLFYVLLCQTGLLESDKTKDRNLRSEGEVKLLTAVGCDSSKVFPSDNQHLQ